ncbi:MAG: DNA repair protein [Acutalibacteraceae bacterium]|nr:DNA repair protein [Acutalibacteraceae bacterium]
MTDKELRKLSRSELLEMLLIQSKEVERLKNELEEANRKLEDRRIILQESGSIAEAALKLNDIFEVAQKAANQYLESIKSSGESSAERIPYIFEDEV